MRRAGLFLALSLLFFASHAIASPTEADPEEKRGTLVIESGKDVRGRTVYNLRAIGAEIQDVLKLLFSQIGAEYAIDQDVKGTVSVTIKSATMEQVLQHVVDASQPPIRIKRVGKTLRVSLEPVPGRRTERIETMYGVGGFGSQPGLSRYLGGSPQRSLERPVTLDIPDSRPIPFGEALQLIGQQTQITLRLDKSVRSDIRFSARFTQTPLQFVLDSIARTGALKWALLPDGSILIAPADRWQVYVGANPVLGYPNQPCPRCRQVVIPVWNYCPNCGQTMPRRALPNSRRNTR